jgi:hypothetical protein
MPYLCTDEHDENEVKSHLPGEDAVEAPFVPWGELQRLSWFHVGPCLPVHRGPASSEQGAHFHRPGKEVLQTEGEKRD